MVSPLPLILCGLLDGSRSFPTPVCAAGITVALVCHWILSDASAVGHRLEKIFFASNINSRSRKCLSVKRISMENVHFQGLCTDSKILM